MTQTIKIWGIPVPIWFCGIILLLWGLYTWSTGGLSGDFIGSIMIIYAIIAFVSEDLFIKLTSLISILILFIIIAITLTIAKYLTLGHW